MILEDYTEEQILKLTDEDVSKIIKLHLAENGIKLLKLPSEPEYFEVPQKDKKLFKVTGFEYYFEKEEDAKELQTVIRQKFSSLKGTAGYDDDCRESRIDSYYIKDVSSIKVEDNLVYSSELFTQVAKKISDNAKLKKDYDEVKKEYDDNYEASAETRAVVFDRINEVKTKYNNFEEMKIKFNEYLELANQQEDVAWSFLEKAYTINQECKDYIKA